MEYEFLPTQSKLSVVVPVYRGQDTLHELFARLTSTMEGLDKEYELIFVEDCGGDDSWRIINGFTKLDGRVIAAQMAINSGQGATTLAGISLATGDFIITLDDDLQHPPEEIPVLLNTLVEDESLDVTIGYRKRSI